MENRSYHEQKNVEYTKELRNYLSGLPSFVTTYFRGIEQKTQPRSRLAYAIDLSVFFNWLHSANPMCNANSIKDISLDDISMLQTFDIEEYMEYLKLYENKMGVEVTNHESALKRKMSALRSMFGYLYRNQLIDSNPTVKVDMPKLHDKAIVRFDPSEIAEFLDTVDNGLTGMSVRQAKAHDQNRLRDIAIMTLLLGTGVRVSECVGIDLKDLDLNNSRVKVTRKGGNEAYIYFSDEVKNALLDYLNEREQMTDVQRGFEDALFLSSQKKRICVRSVEILVKKYASNVTTVKKITPHKLRSTFGTALYRETGDIYLVADVLGHKDVNTTKKHYAALDEDRKRKAKDIVKLRDRSDI